MQNCYTGEHNDATDLRCSSTQLKRTKSSVDNHNHHQHHHFMQLDASGGDKCPDTNVHSSGASEYEYVRALKENKQYFLESAYNNAVQQRQRNAAGGEHCGSVGSDSYDFNSGGGPDKNYDRNNHLQHSYVNDYDDSLSMNGDSSKDLLISSSGNGSASGGNSGNNNNNNNINNNETNGTMRSTKRKHFNSDDDNIHVDSDNNDNLHKIYKNNCGDSMTTTSSTSAPSVATSLVQNKFDYMKNFDSIRARSFDEIPNDERHHHLLGATSTSDYRINSSDDLNSGNSRCNDDGGGGVNSGSINYASSDDLNQTNASEHDDKNMSGSDDESGGGSYSYLL